MIVLCDLDNSDVLQYGTPVGADTQDRVFLLSGDEGQKYLTNDELRTAVPTRQALSQGAYTNSAGQCAWWLRSPGMTETSPAYYASAGSIGSRAHELNETIIGVRPAMWVKMELEENADSSTAKFCINPYLYIALKVRACIFKGVQFSFFSIYHNPAISAVGSIYLSGN